MFKEPKSKWVDLKKKCTEQGKRLCNVNEVCNNNMPKAGLVKGADAWLAIDTGKQNQWVQVGDNPHKPCTLHESLGSDPSWGLTGEFDNTYYKCCDDSDKERKKIERGLGIGTTIVIMCVILCCISLLMGLLIVYPFIQDYLIYEGTRKVINTGSSILNDGLIKAKTLFKN